MILFQSDYLEGCHPKILEKLQETNLMQTPGYGKDEFCEQAAEAIRTACGAPEADVHFLVGGTQTNSTVIASVLRPYQGVMCATTGHINVHETGTVEHSGHKVLPLPSKDGKVSAKAVKTALEAHFSESSPEHEVQPGMLYISFPTELGTIYSFDELMALHQVCSDWGIPLFIDGARLGFGLAAQNCDLTLRDIAALSDIFYIGGTKQGALFGEAVVITNPLLKDDFRYMMKQGGGLLAKGRLLGIQFGTLFEDGLYFSISQDTVRRAQTLADAFHTKGYEFFVESPTNQIFPILPKEVAQRLSADFCFEHWQNVGRDRVAVRFCTSWATTDAQIDALIKAL